MNKIKIKEAVFNYTILVIAVAIVLIPITFMVSTSFKSIEEIMTSRTATLFPRKFSLEGYKNVTGNYPFITYFKNSVLTTSFATIFCVALSTLAGYGFSRFKFKGKTSLMFFVLTTQMFPSVMLFVPFYKLLSIYGLSKSLVGLILVYISSVIPFCTWMMYGFFESISKELDEAASIDGCGRFKIFFVIVAPLTLPGIITTTIYSFIHCWNEYMFTMIIATKDQMKTLTVAIGEMAGFYKIMWNDLMAASVLSCLPLIVLFIFLQKYFISSMTQGAVKG
jgi:multiple sugar transport system permease protein/raffinose/stachyose/melibiose transport system permease protein